MDLKDCAKCGKIFARDLLGPLETGEFGVLSFDRRPKTCAPGVAGRGLVSGAGRLGAIPDWKRFQVERVVLACAACGGAVKTAEPPPIWKTAREAWATWKTEDGGAEWIKLAPAHVKKRLGLLK